MEEKEIPEQYNSREKGKKGEREGGALDKMRR